MININGGSLVMLHNSRLCYTYLLMPKKLLMWFNVSRHQRKAWTGIVLLRCLHSYFELTTLSSASIVILIELLLGSHKILSKTWLNFNKPRLTNKILYSLFIINKILNWLSYAKIKYDKLLKEYSCFRWWIERSRVHVAGFQACDLM